MLLVTSEILGLFVITLATNDKYSHRNTENFPQQIQMELSQKQNNFSQFSIAFVNFQSLSEYSEKEDESHCLIISNIIDFFGNKRVKGSQGLLKSARQHFYTTVPLI